ncbi:hypothetical protein B0H13DRAFT_2361495 [Mycena leptocephala]|nr:hypothetical protein B0H13DRAFT_2361495 [Mycena leptocephala]
MTVAMYQGDHAKQASDFRLAKEYVQMMSHQQIYPLVSKMWIRSSTGRLCAEPAEESFRPSYYLLDDAPESSWTPSESDSLAFLHEAQPESYMDIVSSMPLELYHSLCLRFDFSLLPIKIPLSETVRVGAPIFCPSSTESFDSQAQIVAFSEPVSVHYDGWKCSYTGLTGKLLDNGWTRYAIQIHRSLIRMSIYCEDRGWLSQANHIFGQLHANSNHHDYGYIHRCGFELRISRIGPDVPSGYLFVCPQKDLQVGPSSFQWPDRPAYWSHDPDGLDPIDTEEAARLGYPTIELQRYVGFWSWNSGVYKGLRQFHKAKRFDPDSQELARHLGHSLFKLTDPLIPFTIERPVWYPVFDEKDDDHETPDPLVLDTPNISDVAQDSDVEDELHLSAL